MTARLVPMVSRMSMAPNPRFCRPLGRLGRVGWGWRGSDLQGRGHRRGTRFGSACPRIRRDAKRSLSSDDECVRRVTPPSANAVRRVVRYQQGWNIDRTGRYENEPVDGDEERSAERTRPLRDRLGTPHHRTPWRCRRERHVCDLHGDVGLQRRHRGPSRTRVRLIGVTPAPQAR